MCKRVGVALVVLGLAACGAPRPRAPAPQTPNQPAPILQALPAPGTYPIDSSKSELRVLVYRAGALARLGHNHVLVNRAVSGTVQIAEPIGILEVIAPIFRRIKRTSREIAPTFIMTRATFARTVGT